jgi:hypothetical protein
MSRSNQRQPALPRKIASILNLRPAFLRSVNVALDYADPNSSRDYVVTGFIREVMGRVSAGLRRSSTERAWRITGDYGSGKSAFALAFARLAAGEKAALPEALRKILPTDVKLLPVLVSGAPEPIEHGIRKALGDCRRRWGNGAFHALRDSKHGHDALLASIDEHVAFVRKKGIADGLVLIMDELGQNLHYAALHPSGGDISLLQRLGEKADRSQDRPLMVIAMLHQGIGTYSADLDVAARREWDKVAGRFKEVVFAHPIEQVVSLVAEMLGVQLTDLPSELHREPRLGMIQAIAAGLYGAAPAEESLACEAHRFYPLHATVLPLLIRLLRRFGQNERSLVGFLTSHEPFGFREFAELHAVGEKFYRLPDLYDHFKANIAPSLVNGHAAQWEVIDSAVSQAHSLEEPAAAVLKTVGLINLINDPTVAATEQLLKTALGHPQTTSAIKRLRDSASLIHERGTAKGLSLWSHTSVNLDNALDSADEALSKESVGASAVAARFASRAIVARRHYIETGNLRHFVVRYMDFAAFRQELAAGIKTDPSADGQIVVVLTNDEAEVARARALADEQRARLGDLTIVGVSSPVVGVAEIIREHRRWKWIKENTKELAGDVYARGHVNREIKRCENHLEKELYYLAQLRNAPERQAAIFWIDINGAVRNANAGILPHLSDRCDRVFNRAPRVANELINRRVTSAAASRARSDLIEALATAADKEFLGLDSSKNPPEMAIYRSVLLEGKVHVPTKSGWRVRRASEFADEDPLQLGPTLCAIHELLVESDLKRTAVPEIFAKLRAQPYGVRDGLMTLLVAIYLAGQWEYTAVYEDGTFVEKPGAAVFQRLAKEPEAFHLQHCSVRGIRLELFNRVASVLNLPANERPDVLAVVRPLMIFAARLSEYSRNTERHLTSGTRKMRSILIEAREPATLLFSDLPKALGFEVFTTKGAKASDPTGFADALNAAVLELRESLPRLRQRVADSVLAGFRYNGTAAEFRAEFTLRLRALQGRLTDPELRVFAMRMGDASLAEKEWCESVASYVMHKPIERWRDSDEDEFHTRMANLAARFGRAEAAGFNGSAIDPQRQARAVRFTLTRPDGREVDQVVHWTAREDAALEETKVQLKRLLDGRGNAGMAAAAQIVWEALEGKKDEHD